MVVTVCRLERFFLGAGGGGSLFFSDTLRSIRKKGDDRIVSIKCFKSVAYPWLFLQLSTRLHFIGRC